MQSTKKISYIVNQLNHPLPAIRYNAARVLGELKDPNAVTHLVNTFYQDDSERVRQAAANALVLLGIDLDEMAIPDPLAMKSRAN
jgi:HEAT repeat protein